MKSLSIKQAGVVGLTVILSLLLIWSLVGDKETALAVQPTLKAVTVAPAAQVFHYPVVGVVEAKQVVDVKARQAGVVREVLVTEGQRVEFGQVLAVQSNPVLEARLGQQAVTALITELAQESRLLQVQSAATIARIEAGQTVTVTNLSNQAQEIQLARLNEQVEAGLANFVATVPRVLRFVQDNKTLFTAESNKRYDLALSRLYRITPSYLKVNNITRGTVSGDVPLATMELLARATSTTDLVAAANQALLNLDDLNAVLFLSQGEFLDKNNLASDDSRYTDYLVNRESLLSLKQSLSEATAGLEALRDNNEIGSYTRQVESELAKIGEETTRDVAGVSSQLAIQTANLSAADRAVLLAELNEGILRAPFSGTITKVMVENGEYFLPGTALFRLVDTANTEVAVTVPAFVGERVVIGSKIYQADTQVGEVVRLSRVAEAGSQTIFIALTDGLVGSSFVGGLEIVPATDGERMVSRRHMHFDTRGPFVVTTAGIKIPVDILFDAGQSLLVELDIDTEEELVKAVGSRL